MKLSENTLAYCMSIEFQTRPSTFEHKIKPIRLEIRYSRSNSSEIDQMKNPASKMKAPNTCRGERTTDSRWLVSGTNLCTNNAPPNWSAFKKCCKRNEPRWNWSLDTRRWESEKPPYRYVECLSKFRTSRDAHDGPSLDVRLSRRSADPELSERRRRDGCTPLVEFTNSLRRTAG